MRVLVLSQYYPPDLSAGSFRTGALVGELDRRLADDGQVEVITTLPNRYKSFSVEAPEYEDLGKVTVRRIALPAHRSGMLDQAWAYRKFVRGVLSITRSRRYDLVYATSSRLFTTALGAYCAGRCGARLYLDIRDIFNDTIQEAVDSRAIRVLMPLLDRVERYAVGRATRVNLVSPGFRAYFESRYPGRRFSVITNGIDEEFLQADFSVAGSHGKNGRTVVYAGNIGKGQGLEHILPGLAKRLAADGIVFEIIGDGGTRQKLKRALDRAGVDNVKLLDPMPRNRLIESYAAADILFLHLNDFKAFEKVLPSKIFECAATGKPILAGVAGCAAEFLGREVRENVAIFPPGDVDAAAAAVRTLNSGVVSRDRFVARFRRSELINQLADDLLETARSSS